MLTLVQSRDHYNTVSGIILVEDGGKWGSGLSTDFQKIGKDVAVCPPITINKSALPHTAIFLKVPISFELRFPLRLPLNEGK